MLDLNGIEKGNIMPIYTIAEINCTEESNKSCKFSLIKVTT